MKKLIIMASVLAMSSSSVLTAFGSLPAYSQQQQYSAPPEPLTNTPASKSGGKLDGRVYKKAQSGQMPYVKTFKKGLDKDEVDRRKTNYRKENPTVKSAHGERPVAGKHGNKNKHKNKLKRDKDQESYHGKKEKEEDKHDKLKAKKPKEEKEEKKGKLLQKLQKEKDEKKGGASYPQIDNDNENDDYHDDYLLGR